MRIDLSRLLALKDPKAGSAKVGNPELPPRPAVSVEPVAQIRPV